MGYDKAHNKVSWGTQWGITRHIMGYHEAPNGVTWRTTYRRNQTLHVPVSPDASVSTLVMRRASTLQDWQFNARVSVRVVRHATLAIHLFIHWEVIESLNQWNFILLTTTSGQLRPRPLCSNFTWWTKHHDTKANPLNRISNNRILRLNEYDVDELFSHSM